MPKKIQSETLPDFGRSFPLKHGVTSQKHRLGVYGQGGRRAEPPEVGKQSATSEDESALGCPNGPVGTDPCVQDLTQCINFPTQLRVDFPVAAN
jgi:hypothetical protein